MLRVLIARHGETEWNRTGRYQGKIDIPLNNTGRGQARAASKALSEVPFAGAFASPLRRARETAELILEPHKEIRLETIPALKEIDHGAWEGLLKADVEGRFPGMIARWDENPETVTMPGGESLADVRRRAAGFWEALIEKFLPKALQQDLNVLLVSHDAVNRLLICHVLGLGDEAFWRIKQGNACINVVEINDLGQRVALLNYTGHMGMGVFDLTAAGAL